MTLSPTHPHKQTSALQTQTHKQTHKLLRRIQSETNEQTHYNLTRTIFYSFTSGAGSDSSFL
jgi:hypothetical protein